MHTYFFFLCGWLSNSPSFLSSREMQKQPRSYNTIVYSRGCQPHLPLSGALFPSQSRFTCILLVSPCALTSTQQRQRSRNSISFVLESSAWTCDCAIRDIMAPELVPYPHAFFSPTAFILHDILQVSESHPSIYRHSLLYKIPQLAALDCCEHAQRETVYVRMCKHTFFFFLVWILRRKIKKVNKNDMFVCVWLGL